MKYHLKKNILELNRFFISYFPGRRQDGDGRGVPHGGHGALLRGAAGRDAEAVGRRRGAGVLLKVQRVPAQRLS